MLELDEYVGVRGSDPASLRHWLESHLSKRVALARVEYMDGMAGNLAEECARYEAIVRERPSSELR